MLSRTARLDDETESQIAARIQRARSNFRPGWFIFGGIFVGGLILPRYVFLSEEVLAFSDAGDIISAVGVLYVFEVLTLFCLYLVLETNPGYVVRTPYPLNSHFCPQCRVMVNEFDHHCGVLGVCVGKGNLKYFIAFLFFATMLSSVSVVLGGNFLLCLVRLTYVLQAFQSLELKEFLIYLIKVFFSIHRIIGLAGCIVSIQGGVSCFVLFVIYLIKAVTGSYSLERRRNEPGTLSLAVFSGFFSPQFSFETNPERETLV